MTPGRTDRIARAVEAGKPDAAAEPPPQAPHAIDDVVRSMPRRKILNSLDNAAVTLPMARRVTFRPGVFYPLLRLLVWMRVCVYFLFGNAVDVLLGRSSPQ